MKINQNDWTYIGKCNDAAKWLRPLCEYKLIEENNGNFRREQRIGLIAYAIICIPVHILQALYCMWDGGPKEMEWQGRFLGYDTLVRGSEPWEKAKEIYERG